MSETLAMLKEKTIFAIVSNIYIIMAWVFSQNYITSKKILESYDPFVLIEKLKARDLKASHYFSIYIDELMRLNILKYLTPAHVDNYKDDLVSEFYEKMFGARMRVDEITTKEQFLNWISWEVGHYVLDFRKKKQKIDPVSLPTNISIDNGEEDIIDDDEENGIKYDRELLEYLLNQINPDYAELIRMSVYEGLKPSQIALRIDRTPRYVTDKKSKGIASLTKKAIEYKRNYYNGKQEK